MYQVKGKWALITGAARGIGYLTARFMAEQGCNLILHSRSLAHTERVLSEVRSCGISALAVEADLNDPDAVQRMLNEIDALGVDVDIVLNNAGLQIAYRTEYCETPVSDFEISFRVNTPGRLFRQQGGSGKDHNRTGFEGGRHGCDDQSDGSRLVPDRSGRFPGAERTGKRDPWHCGRRVCR